MKIFLVTGEPFATSTTGDSRSAGMTAADLQARNESLYPREKGYAR